MYFSLGMIRVIKSGEDKRMGTWPTYVEEGKVKAIPLQAWTGPEGSRRLRLPDLKTIGT